MRRRTAQRALHGLRGEDRVTIAWGAARWGRRTGERAHGSRPEASPRGRGNVWWRNGIGRSRPVARLHLACPVISCRACLRACRRCACRRARRLDGRRRLGRADRLLQLRSGRIVLCRDGQSELALELEDASSFLSGRDRDLERCRSRIVLCRDGGGEILFELCDRLDGARDGCVGEEQGSWRHRQALRCSLVLRCSLALRCFLGLR